MSKGKSSNAVHFIGANNVGFQIGQTYGNVHIHPSDPATGRLQAILAPSGAEVDIVFVYTLPGPHGMREATESHPWRKALQQMGSPVARVFTFEHSDIMDKDSDALEYLSSILMRRVADTRREVSNRPLIWVAHSLSGILVEKALIDLHGGLREQLQVATKGICFLGTPHRSSSIAAWSNALMACSQALNGSARRSKLLRAVRSRGLDTEQLSAVSTNFRRFINRSDIAILTLLETRRSATANGAAFVVPPEIGILRYPEEIVRTMDCNHMELLGFILNEDGYSIFRAFVVDIVTRVHALNGNESSHPNPIQLLTAKVQSFTSNDQTAQKSVEDKDSRIEQGGLSKLADDWLDESSIPDCHPSTCTWLLDTVEWRNWLNDQGCLLLEGQPGSGKTVFAKFVARELRNLSSKALETSEPASESPSQQEVRPVLVYFFDSTRPNRCSFVGLLRSILYQLITLKPSVLESTQTKNAITGRSWNPEKLKDLLLIVLTNQANIVGSDMVIDGLDECQTADQREVWNFASAFSRIVNSRIFITSRTLLTASHSALNSRLRRINLADKHSEVSKDISNFVEASIDALARKRIWPDATRSRVSKILHTAPTEGSFLYIEILLHSLEQERRIRGIDTILSRRVSSDIQELLDHFLSDSQNQEQQRDMLACVYFPTAAKEPLTFSELSTLLAIARYQRSNSESDQTAGLEMNGIVQEYTVDLPEVVEQRLPLLRLSEGRVLIIHEVVKQYLSLEENANKLLRAWNRPFRNFPARGLHELSEVHCFMAEACLIYLLAALSTQEDPLDFFKYAWAFWSEHVRKSGAILSDTAVELVSKFRIRYLTITSPGHTELRQLLSASKIPLGVKIWPTSDEPIHMFVAFDVGAALRRLSEERDWQDIRDQENRTPLHIAVANNAIHTVQWIIDQSKEIAMTPRVEELLLSVDRDNLSAIHYAVSSDMVEVAVLLLDCLQAATRFERPLLDREHGVKSVEMLNCLWLRRRQIQFEQAEISLLLGAAIKFGESDIINELLTPQALNRMPSRNALSVLFAASSAGSIDTVASLLERDMDINGRDDDNFTPLQIAVTRGRTKIVEILLDNGADVDVMGPKGQTALHLSASGGDLAIARLLLESGSDVLFADEEGHQSLHLAALAGHLDMCNYLIRQGADVDAFDLQGRTPLQLAAPGDHPDVVKLLLQRGADPHVFDLANKSPLHNSAEAGSLAAVVILLEGGASPDLLTVDHQSPLHLAIQYGHVDVVAALLRYGADPNLPDANEKTPIQLAYKAKRNSDRLVEELLVNGAKAKKRDLDSNNIVMLLDKRPSDTDRDRVRVQQINDLTDEIDRLEGERVRMAYDSLRPRGDGSTELTIVRQPTSYSRSRSLASTRGEIIVVNELDVERKDPERRRRRRYLSHESPVVRSMP